MANNPFVQSFAKGEWSEGEDPEQTDRGRGIGGSLQAGAAIAGGDAAAAAESRRAEVKQPLVPDSRGQPVTMATASAVGHPFLNQNLNTKEVTEGSLVSATGFEEYSPEIGAARCIPSFESHCMISSDSGIEMTPGDSIDLAKTLVDPIGSEKVEVQNYIDMCRPGESKAQELSKTFWEEKMMSFVDNTSADTEAFPQNLKKSVEEIKLIEEASPCLSPEEPTTAPYVEEPSDEDISEKWDMGDTQHSIHIMDTCASPAQVVLTEIETIVDPNSKSPHEQETKPKQGSDVVPTVTVSEPDDDSPISQTPTPSSSEESDSQIEAAYHLLEEERPTAFKTSEQTHCFSLNATAEERSLSATLTKLDESEQNLPKLPATTLDLEASSAESGDSEIELVPDESLFVEEAEGCSYMTFRQVGGTPPSSVSSVQYSILREEREAELDSELIIDPYDASSASEENLQREQDSPMKSDHMGRESDGKALTMDNQQESDRQPSRSAEYPASCILKSTNGTDADTAEPPSPLNYSAAFITPEVVVEEPSPEEVSEETSRKISDSKTSDGAKTGKDLGSSQPITSEPFLLVLNKKTVIDLLYWHDIKQTGIVFGSVLLLLFSLTQFSVVSVIAYLALAALSATISFRIYKSVLQAVQKTDEGHPFKAYLDMDTTLSEEQIQKYADSALVYVNSTVKELRRLFLVQDLVDSLKFAVLMWLLTYVGAIFNGLTLMIMAVVSMFTLPVVYEKYQAQIDQYLGLVRTHVNSVVAKIQAKIPGAKRKTE
uniref:reticulon-1a isoform X2 n=1 Tax=Pristiophorus japonicus TaxID=55135 RepID=UPI00398EFF3E